MPSFGRPIVWLVTVTLCAAGAALCAVGATYGPLSIGRALAAAGTASAPPMSASEIRPRRADRLRHLVVMLL